MNEVTKLENLNIRATALSDFWGTDYEQDIYLWEGAKNNLTLQEILQINEPTFKDLFSTPEDRISAKKYCKKAYLRYIDVLTLKLNDIHDLNLPSSFWKTVFGYWLYRHICIVYEKYCYLSKLDIDKTSIKLLDKNSFFTPIDAMEYIRFFSTDEGVQQLVSQYYYLFKSNEFPIIKKKIEFNAKVQDINSSKNKNNIIVNKRKFLYGIFEKIISIFVKPQIVLLSTFYSSEVLKQIILKNKGKIQRANLPTIKKKESRIDKVKRQKLLTIDTNNDFDAFLVSTFYFSIPKLLIEDFRNYYDSYFKGITKSKFTHIVSEGWITNFSLSIYCAIARNRGSKFICQEHAAGSIIYENSLTWLDQSIGDVFLTTGWKSNEIKIQRGGFNKKNYRYEFSEIDKKVLFISHTRFPYLMEFGPHSTNSTYISALESVNEFLELIPDQMKTYFWLRPRRANFFWDTEFALEIKKKNIKIDNSNFIQSILESKIIIIDHIATGVAELIMMNAPFILLINSNVDIEENYSEIFIKLNEAKIVHNSPKSAIDHLLYVYDDVESWWQSTKVQNSINEIKNSYLASSSKTVDYINSCLEE